MRCKAVGESYSLRRHISVTQQAHNGCSRRGLNRFLTLFFLTFFIGSIFYTIEDALRVDLIDRLYFAWSQLSSKNRYYFTSGRDSTTNFCHTY